jgi:hypothetical protein
MLPHPRTSIVLNRTARTVFHPNPVAADIRTIADLGASAQPPVRQLLDLEAVI